MPRTLRKRGIVAVYVGMLWAAGGLILPGGAVDALQLTRHAVLARVTISALPASHGRRYRIVSTPEDTAVIETLLHQLGSGAWPGVSPYGRKACRLAMKKAKGER